MQTLNQQKWIKQLNTFSSRYMMPAMFVLFLCIKTFLYEVTDEKIETVQNLIILFLLFDVVCNLLFDLKGTFTPWIKDNILVIIYFVVRFISFYKSGFDYSVLRTIFMEVFFLVCICKFTVRDKKSGKFYVWFYIWFELILTACSIIVYNLVPYMNENMYALALKYTYLEKMGISMLIGNVNTMGIMAGLAVVLAWVLYGKKDFNKIFLCFYGVYNLVILYLSGCRSAQVGIIAAVLFMIIKQLIPSIKEKTLAITALCLMICALIPLYGTVIHYESEGNMTYEPFEQKLDSISSGRYAIWKECVLVQEDNIVFGVGNLKNEKEERKELAYELNEESINENGEAITEQYMNVCGMGIHNGYLGMISATGIAGFLLFVLILIQKILRAGLLNHEKWYLLLVFMFTINCFESLFIIGRFFQCFCMFLILEADVDMEENNNCIQTKNII